MTKPHIRKLTRIKKAHDDEKRTQKLWEKILTNEGVSMNRGLSDNVSYVGTTKELIVLEKLQKK